MSNMPCVGCWWKESGRCFNEKLAFVHGYDRVPRYGTHPETPPGLEITDALITECVEQTEFKSKKAVVSRTMNQLNKDLKNAQNRSSS